MTPPAGATLLKIDDDDANLNWSYVTIQNTFGLLVHQNERRNETFVVVEDGNIPRISNFLTEEHHLVIGDQF